MSPEVHDAILSSCSVTMTEASLMRPVAPRKLAVSVQLQRLRLLNFLRGLPDEMTVRDLIEDMETTSSEEGEDYV